MRLRASSDIFSRLRRKGFTLIEIMMVVAIIGLTLTLGFPAFLRTFQRDGMRKAEYDLIEACKVARRAAIMKNETVSLVFDPRDGAFSVPGAFEAKQIPGDVAIEIMGVNFIQCEMADHAEVHFHPNGTSDEFTIVLHASNGERRKLSLDIMTALPVMENM